MHAVTSHRDACRKFATIRDHSLDFYQLVYRLVATGQKVATVARSVNAHGKVSYRLSEKLGFKLISGRTHWKLQYANVRITMSKTRPTIGRA